MKIAAALVLVASLVPRPSAAAPDCDGGTLVKLHATPGRLAFQATVTRPGATHATLLGGVDFQLTLVRSDGGPPFSYAVDIPPDRFVTRGAKTFYDHGGSFHGDVVLKDTPGQADTVRITFRDAAFAPTGEVAGDLRAYFTTSGRCARTCAA